MISIKKVRKNTQKIADNTRITIDKKRKDIEAIIDKKIEEASNNGKYEVRIMYGRFCDLFKASEGVSYRDVNDYVNEVIMPAYREEGYSIETTFTDLYNAKNEELTVSWAEGGIKKADMLYLGEYELFVDEQGEKCKKKVEYYPYSNIKKRETVWNFFHGNPDYMIEYDEAGKINWKTEYDTSSGSVMKRTLYDKGGYMINATFYTLGGKAFLIVDYFSGQNKKKRETYFRSEDGSIDFMYTYNTDGHRVEDVYYDSDENVSRKIGYNSDKTVYYDIEFNPDKKVYTTKFHNVYYANGAKDIFEYDSDGNCIKTTKYYPNGKKESV